jgi:ribulose 1,5-bisphosphate synthetase/thiazole synthase
MKTKQILLAIIKLTILTFLLYNCKSKQNLNYADVVIYGGTSAGISAAIQAARLEKSVIIIEPAIV